MNTLESRKLLIDETLAIKFVITTNGVAMIVSWPEEQDIFESNLRQDYFLDNIINEDELPEQPGLYSGVLRCVATSEIIPKPKDFWCRLYDIELISLFE